MSIKNLYVYLIAFFSSVLTFVFFYFSSEVIKEEKVVEEKINIYEVAKEEAIKLGRMEDRATGGFGANRPRPTSPRPPRGWMPPNLNPL